MSKVKIQGNASGTGIFTVAAPATNTDRTLTLPDVDATVLTTAGGTISGSLILQTTGSDVGITIKETSAANFAQYLKLADSTTDWFVVNRYAGSGFGIGTTNSGDMLQIDTLGRVTKPSQPTFMQVSLTGYNSVGYLKGTGTAYNLNRGNHYNSTNGRFTAPVAGIYLFMCGILVESGSGRLEGFIAINGNQKVNFNGTGTTYDGPTSIAILDLGVGDYVTVVKQSGTAHSDGAHPSTYFGGYLLG